MLGEARRVKVSLIKAEAVAAESLTRARVAAVAAEASRKEAARAKARVEAEVRGLSRLLGKRPRRPDAHLECVGIGFELTLALTQITAVSRTAWTAIPRKIRRASTLPGERSQPLQVWLVLI